jgi:hypothetical protein
MERRTLLLIGMTLLGFTIIGAPRQSFAQSDSALGSWLSITAMVRAGVEDNVQLAAQTSPPATALTNERDAIQRVLSGYYDAFGRDPAEAASFYGEPTNVVLPTEVLTLNKRTDVQAFLANLLVPLKPLGYSYSKISDPRIKFLSETTAFYSCIAIRYKTDGTEIQRLGATYLLHKNPSGWQIHELIVTDLDKLMSPD